LNPPSDPVIQDGFSGTAVRPKPPLACRRWHARSLHHSDSSTAAIANGRYNINECVLSARSGLPPCADQRPFPKAEPPLDEVTMMGNRSPDAKENSSNTEWPNRTPDAFMIRSGDE
jgi:hypothetical protein